MNTLMQILYRLRRTVLRRLRWRTRGVKVMLFNQAGELLLIRNSYGRTEMFTLPGGGIGMFETPVAAALREVREEVGVTADKLKLRSIHFSEAEGKRDSVHLFTAYTPSEPNADSMEVEEVRFFPLDGLPEPVSPATLRRIAEYRGETPVDPRW